MRPIILIQCILLCAACGDDPPAPDGQTQMDLFPTTDNHVTAPCNSTNCSTCCIETVCVDVVTRTACGFGGNPCKKCRPGEDCEEGKCLNLQCTQANCEDGCCDPNLGCQKGTTKEACGRGAITCQTCEGEELCINGKCAPRESDTYKIILKSATLLQDTSCGLWDDCDPKVELFIGDDTEASGTSEWLEDNYQPTWNEELLTAPAADILKRFMIKVQDDDELSDDLISECTWKITEDDLAFGSIINHCGTDVQDLTFEFQPQ